MAPVQINLIPVNNTYHLDYVKELYNKLVDCDIRVQLDDREEKLSYKMHESQTKKIPLTIIIGDKEKDNNEVSYRRFGEQSTTTLSIDEFINNVNDVIKSRKHNI